MTAIGTQSGLVGTDGAAALAPTVGELPGDLFRPVQLSRWQTLLAPLLSAAVLVSALLQLRTLDLHHVIAMVPGRPLFWLAFAASYFCTPAFDWLIFRRLWSLPPGGFLALTRKRISNEILLGYSGEAYFYAWARRRVPMEGSPFGAVKDVAVLSAAVANLLTLLLVAASWRLLVVLPVRLEHGVLFASVGTIVASFAGMIGLRRRVFTADRRALGFIALIHTLRVAAWIVLTALVWAAALPTAPLVWWVLLSTFRMLISRLPFVPNKDLVFAGLTSFMIGHDAEITQLLAMVAGLMLATHVLLGIALALGDLVSRHFGQQP